MQSQRLKGYVARAPRPESEIRFQDSETLETLETLISFDINLNKQPLMFLFSVTHGDPFFVSCENM